MDETESASCVLEGFGIIGVGPSVSAAGEKVH
jgi:hypothetical protein